PGDGDHRSPAQQRGGRDAKRRPGGGHQLWDLLARRVASWGAALRDVGLAAEQQHRCRLSVRRQCLAVVAERVPAGGRRQQRPVVRPWTGVNVIATGGSDGSCVPGKGTFVIRNSNNCGVVDRPAILTLNTTSV